MVLKEMGSIAVPTPLMVKTARIIQTPPTQHMSTKSVFWLVITVQLILVVTTIGVTRQPRIHSEIVSNTPKQKNENFRFSMNIINVIGYRLKNFFDLFWNRWNL